MCWLVAQHHRIPGVMLSIGPMVTFGLVNPPEAEAGNSCAPGVILEHITLPFPRRAGYVSPMRAAYGVRVLVFLTLSTSLGGCVEANVTTLRHLPARRAGCAMEVFPSKLPSYPWVDVATIEVKCSGRSTCIEELMAQTCKAGGDTLYGLTDGRAGAATIVIGTVGLRTAASPSPTPVSPVGETRVGGCDPICSPGYKCIAAVCEPQCNPACESGTICGRDRTCKPAAPTTPATKL